jgi:uncharacterized protein YjbI with pentapeptide repeats
VGAGAGGIIALVITARRQWLGERAQLHQESIAASNIQDAAERRITELYGKGVDQLGSEKAAVRLGGLLALERLAQANDDLRQTIVDVVCAYLRMPFDVPETTQRSFPTAFALQSVITNETQKQELQVRHAAQEILRRHLKPGKPELFWCQIRIDLSGATLAIFNLEECEIAEGVFSSTRFIGTTRFNGCHVLGWAGFRDARFTGFAGFQGVTFGGGARFDGAAFKGACNFERAVFTEGARFDGVEFDGSADLSESIHNKKSIFSMAHFRAAAIFTSARFLDETHFSRTVFNKYARFRHCQFSGALLLTNTLFRDEARFTAVKFGGRLRVIGATFQSKAGFGESEFNQHVIFRDVIFDYLAKFGNAHFRGSVTFNQTTVRGEFRMNSAQIANACQMESVRFHDAARIPTPTAPGYLTIVNCTVMDPALAHEIPTGWTIDSTPLSTLEYPIRRLQNPIIP